MLRGIILAAMLTTTWPNGYVQRSPCIDETVCAQAARLDLARGAIATTITPNLSPSAAGFPPGWDCINGHNCDGTHP